jgi:hypothetical protein
VKGRIRRTLHHAAQHLKDIPDMMDQLQRVLTLWEKRLREPTKR